MRMRKQLYIITLCLMAGLFALQLVIQNLFLDAMRTVYMNNAESAVSRVVADLQLALSGRRARFGILPQSRMC